MSRITRTESASGIDGGNWYPARDDAGNFILGRGKKSEEAKHAVFLVRTEDDAVRALQTGEFWIRMTATGAPAPSLISPGGVLIDGQRVT
jgi:hypothetical protein